MPSAFHGSTTRQSRPASSAIERSASGVEYSVWLVATITTSAPLTASSKLDVGVATNHSEYSSPQALRTIAELAPDALIVDPWNALGTAQVFAYVAEVAALRA